MFTINTVDRGEEFESLIVSSRKGFSDEALQCIASLVEDNTTYLLNLAASLRQDMFTSHIAIKLLVEIAVAISVKNQHLPVQKRTKLPSVLPNHIPNITKTPQDIVDAIAYYLHRYEGKSNMPLALRRGLAKVLSGFSAEDLLKCKKYKNKRTTIGDAINLLHPKATSHEMMVVYRYLRGWDFDWEETEAVLNKFQIEE